MLQIYTILTCSYLVFSMHFPCIWRALCRQESYGVNIGTGICTGWVDVEGWENNWHPSNMSVGRSWDISSFILIDDRYTYIALSIEYAFFQLRASQSGRLLTGWLVDCCQGAVPLCLRHGACFQPDPHGWGRHCAVQRLSSHLCSHLGIKTGSREIVKSWGCIKRSKFIDELWWIEIIQFNAAISSGCLEVLQVPSPASRVARSRQQLYMTEDVNIINPSTKMMSQVHPYVYQNVLGNTTLRFFPFCSVWFIVLSPDIGSIHLRKAGVVRRFFRQLWKDSSCGQCSKVRLSKGYDTNSTSHAKDHQVPCIAAITLRVHTHNSLGYDKASRPLDSHQHPTAVNAWILTLSCL